VSKAESPVRNAPPPAQKAGRDPVPMLDLKRQYEPLRQEILDALGRVIDSRQFILGEEVAAFERAAAGQLCT